MLENTKSRFLYISRCIVVIILHRINLLILFFLLQAYFRSVLFDKTAFTMNVSDHFAEINYVDYFRVSAPSECDVKFPECEIQYFAIVVTIKSASNRLQTSLRRS